MGNTQNQSTRQQQSARNSVDIALITEAHGLVTDMLNDPTLPPHIVSGLRAVASLLSPPISSISSRTKSSNIFTSVALTDFDPGEEPQEIPYTGERPMSFKRGRRNMPPSVLRRMSTSTWSTTTSATGMPTLEPEPSRKRSTNFRTAQSPNTPNPPSFLSPNERPPVKGGRSFSTTALPFGALAHLREKREHRKLGSIVQASLDSNRDNISPSDIDLHNLRFNRKQQQQHSEKETRSSPAHAHTAAATTTTVSSHHQHQPTSQMKYQVTYHQQTQPASYSGDRPKQDKRIDVSTTSVSDKSSAINPYHASSSSYIFGYSQVLKQTIPRLNLTSDYDSSNDSPSGSETTVEDNVICDSRLSGGRRSAASVSNKGVSTASPSESSLSSAGGSYPIAVAGSSISLARNKDETYCSLCGIALRTLHAKKTSELQPTWPNVSPPPPVSPNLDPFGNYIIGDMVYNVDELSNDPLLNRINEWDYPIFDLNESADGAILSQLSYRIFMEAGLLEAFKIPLVEFLSYFRALELGYRDKPYHNRMHAADVLHGVYYLTSQQIPGFPQIPPDSDESPLQKNSMGPLPKSYLRHISACDDSYGIMGANFPALEIMALYTASAMHDYDHPGRTNAFLVSTFSSQAILYNDRSVLENHHAAAAWSLFISKPEFNWLRCLDKAEFKRFRFLVIEFILATDLKRHFDILAEFNAKVNDEDAPGIDWFSETDRLLVMEMCIKLADINGPCKEHSIHLQWTYRIAEEFYEQGDEEERLGLPISPFMNRRNPQLAKLQESFINHLVAPLCNSYGEAGLLPGLIEVEQVAPTERINERKKSFEKKQESKKEKQRIKKVTCLQTKHLQDNYQFWVNVLKEEQAKSQSGEESPGISSDDSSTPVFSSSQPLHDIAESEEGTGTIESSASKESGEGAKSKPS